MLQQRTTAQSYRTHSLRQILSPSPIPLPCGSVPSLLDTLFGYVSQPIRKSHFQLIADFIQTFIRSFPPREVLSFSTKQQIRSEDIHNQYSKKNQDKDLHQEQRQHFKCYDRKSVSPADYEISKSTPDKRSRDTDISIQIPFNPGVIPPSGLNAFSIKCPATHSITVA